MESKEYEIDLREYFRIIQKRIWIIILITTIAVTSSGLISYLILSPVFEASTTLMVSKPISEEGIIQYTDVLLSQKLVKTYGEIVKSRTVSKQVINNLNLNISTVQLTEMVNVSPVPDTEIIEIRVSHTDPSLGSKIANELANVFMTEVMRIMKVDNVQMIDEAQASYSPVSPKPMLNMIIAGFLGLMIGMGLTFLIEYLDNTIRTPKDVTRYLDLSIIGAIPDTDEMLNNKVVMGVK